ncbi:MAG TPA: carboxypeptidase-like regulatory domain-containing protein, partial [Candidatus Dormibacteraeota bacterium]
KGCANGSASFTATAPNSSTGAPITVTGPLTESPAGSGTFTGTIPALTPAHGAGDIQITITCPNPANNTTIDFTIYIDPSGTVVDTNGVPVVGATVTLLRSDTPTGLTQVTSGSPDMSPANRLNPDTTKKGGIFGWDVIGGYYQVTAAAPGCTVPGHPSKTTVSSPVFQVPPPAVNLTLTLACPDRSTYRAVTPYRVFDSRSSSCVQCAGSFGKGAHQDIQITGNINGGSVPANAIAVALNLTGTGGSASTYLQLIPTGSGTAIGATSSLNLPAGTDQANLVIVPLGTGGKVTLFNHAGRIDAIVDVQGYFVPSPGQAVAGPGGTAGTFHPIAPLRMCDSRGGSGTVCNNTSTDITLGPFQSRAVTLWGSATPATGCIVSTTVVPCGGKASAVVFNLTATGGTRSTYLTAYPSNGAGACDAPPTASTVNVPAGVDRPNRAIVPINLTNGTVCIYDNLGTTNFVIDVNGWFGTGAETTAGALYYPTNPVRLCDTRPGTGTPCSSQTFSANSILPHINLAGSVADGDPANPVAVALNATGTGGTANTYVTIYPDGTAKPNASDLNIPRATDFPVADIVKLGTGGQVDAYNHVGSIDLVIDIVGWFAP